MYTQTQCREESVVNAVMQSLTYTWFRLFLYYLYIYFSELKLISTSYFLALIFSLAKGTLQTDNKGK